MPDLAERLRLRLDRLAHRLGLDRSGRRVQLGLTASLVLLLALVAWSFAYLSPERPGRELTLDQLDAAIARQQVDTATFLDEDATIVAALDDGARVWTAYPKRGEVTQFLLQDLEQSGASVDVDSQPAKARVRVLLTVLLPLMVLANLFALFLTWSRGGAGVGEVVDFGRLASAQRRDGGPRPVTFADVAGVDDAEVELLEVVDYLRAPQRYQQLGAVPPRGVLLFGPPGCGKTLLAKAVAGEAGVPFFSVAGAQFVESLVGVGAARVRDLFARVRESAPAILFIDELDAAGRRRGHGGGGGGSDEREQTLNQLLVEMDGFDTASGVVVIGASNRPDILDPALLRPGRFDRHVHIQPPDLAARAEILRLHGAGRPIARDVDLEALARRTPGFTGADLANVINEAALLTLRERGRTITEHHLNEAVLRVLGGTTSRGHLLSDDERRRIAIHEAGHAVVAAGLGHADRLHRVSVVARGRGLGAVARDRGEDAVVASRTQLVERLVTTLGGRAAELLLLGEPSTAAEDDVERATELAVDLVARYGMDERVGVRRLLAPTVDIHLGDDGSLATLSPELHAELDRAVRTVLDEAHVTATTVVEQHRDGLETLAEVLLEVETLEGPTLAELLPRPSNGQESTPRRRSSRTRS